MGKKNLKSVGVDYDRRIDNVYDHMYKIEDKLDKLIKYLEDSTENPCEKKILELISGKRPY